MTCHSCLWTGQLQWYHTRISKSKTKSSMTVWPEEKMLLQLSQVKSKLAGRSGNVLPKQAGCESVLRPRSRAQGPSPAVADLAQGYRPPAAPCLIKHIYHMFVLSWLTRKRSQQVLLWFCCVTFSLQLQQCLTKIRYRCRAATSGILIPAPTIKEPSLAFQSCSKLSGQMFEWKNSLLVRSACSIQASGKSTRY